jgi:hypothetical protein
MNREDIVKISRTIIEIIIKIAYMGWFWADLLKF